MNKKPIISLGLATLALAIIIGLVQPAKVVAPAQLSEGFFSPVIAFELARSAQDLSFLQGSTAQPVRDSFRLGTKIDMVFAFTYSAFLLLALVSLIQQVARSSTIKTTPKASAKTKLLLVFIGICAVVPIFDVLENTVLLNTLNTYDLGQVASSAQLSKLALYTWAKWLGLAVVFLGFGICFRLLGRQFSAVVMVLVAGFCALAFMTRTPVMGELMALAVGFGILYIFAACGLMTDTIKTRQTP